MVKRHAFLLTTALALLQVLNLTAAHGHDSHIAGVGASGSSETAQSTPAPNSTVAAVMISSQASPSSYFSYAHYSGFMLAHISLMTIAWLFILPVGESNLQMSI